MVDSSQGSNSTRAIAMARRRALSQHGRQAVVPQAGGGSSPSPSASPSTGSASVKPVGGHGGSGRRPPTSSTTGASGRDAARERRRRMAQAGKAGLGPTQERTRATAGNATTRSTAGNAPAAGGAQSDAEAAQSAGGSTARNAGTRSGVSRRRRSAGNGSSDRRRNGKPKPNGATNGTPMNSGRLVAMSHRRAQAARGKQAVKKNITDPGQLARTANPDMSGRDVAKQVRAQRAVHGRTNGNPSPPTGRPRPSRTGGGSSGGSEAPAKVGMSQTSRGESVTGTLVGRSEQTTGDEVGSCASVTGTEYFGADIFQEFCHRPLEAGPEKVGRMATDHGHLVSGTEVGRSPAVTGDEPGTCQRVTGTAYLGPEQFAAYCATPGAAEAEGGNRVTTGGQPARGGEARPQVPDKVAESRTLQGGRVTGTMADRSQRTTGNEAGTCRSVTGDEYVSSEQYQAFCATAPEPEPPKVSGEHTWRGKQVTGGHASRSMRVTGNESGTCTTVTGTPYAGPDQYRSYCPPQAVAAAAERRPTGFAAGLTGQQPGVDRLTGAHQGVCEPVTGTPYVGQGQQAAVCGSAEPANPGDPDFPQVAEGTVIASEEPAGSAPPTAAPGSGFSIMTPGRASQMRARESSHITGTRYGNQGSITGTFSRGDNLVTGTDRGRNNDRLSGTGLSGTGMRPQPPANSNPPAAQANTTPADPSPNITGEGSASGAAITGDGWDRGDRVTGTEGVSSRGRNPTRRGPPMSAMINARSYQGSDEVAVPDSPITGSSGNTMSGAGVTVSGGARG